MENETISKKDTYKNRSDNMIHIKIEKCIICDNDITMKDGYKIRIKGFTESRNEYMKLSVKVKFAHSSCLSEFQSITGEREDD